jgi:biopolymer transport protein ExbD
MQFKTRLRSSTHLIDLTPLVDVIFLMLIFFIVTSDILPLKSLNIETPPLEKDSPPLMSTLYVVMDAQNVIYVGSKKTIVDPYTLKEQLLEELKKLKESSGRKTPNVVISVDRRVDYGSFLKVFSVAQECCSTIRLVYKPESQEQSEYF